VNDANLSTLQKRAALQTIASVMGHRVDGVALRFSDAASRSLLTPAEAEAAAGLLAYPGMRPELRAWFMSEFATATTPERIAEIARHLASEAVALRTAPSAPGTVATRAAAAAPEGLGVRPAPTLGSMPLGSILPTKKNAHADAVADLERARADLGLATTKDARSEAEARIQEAELVIGLSSKPGGGVDSAVRITRYGEEFWTINDGNGQNVTRAKSAVLPTDMVLQGDGTFALASTVTPGVAPGVRTAAEVDVQTQYALFEATNGDGGDKIKQYDLRIGPNRPGNMFDMPVVLVGPHINADTQAKLAARGVIVVRNIAEAVALHNALRQRAAGRANGAKETAPTELAPLPTDANKILFANAKPTIDKARTLTKDLTLQALDPVHYAYLEAKYAGDPKQLAVASAGAVVELLKIHFGKAAVSGQGKALIEALEKTSSPAQRAELVNAIMQAHTRGQVEATLARWRAPREAAAFGGPPSETPTLPAPPTRSAPPVAKAPAPTRELVDRVPKELRVDFLSAWELAGANHPVLESAARAPSKEALKLIVEAYRDTPESHLSGLNALIALQAAGLKKGAVPVLAELRTFVDAIPGFVDAKAHALFMGPLLAAGRDPTRVSEYKERLKILDGLRGPRPLETVTALSGIYAAKAGHPREALISPKLIKLLTDAASVPRSAEPGALPLMAPHEAVRVTETLLSLDKLQMTTFFEACKGKTPEQVTLLLKTLAARLHKLLDKSELPDGLFVCDRAMGEIMEYASWVGTQSHEQLTAGSHIAGHKAEVVDIKDATGKVIDRRTVLVDGSGKQVYGTSCAATTAIMAAAEHDPYIAFLFRKDPAKMFDAQRALMYKEGAAFDRDPAFVPIQYALAKEIIEAQAALIDTTLFDGKTLSPAQQLALKQWQTKRHNPDLITPGSDAAKAMHELSKLYQTLTPEQKKVLASEGVTDARQFLETLALRDAGREATGTLLGNQMRSAEGRTGARYEPMAVRPNALDLTKPEGITRLANAAREFGHVPISVSWGTDLGHAMLLKGPVDVALPGEKPKSCFLIADPATGKAVAVPAEDIGRPDVVRGLGIGEGQIDYVYLPERIDLDDGKARPSLFDARQPLTVLPLGRRTVDASETPFEHLDDRPTLPSPAGPDAVAGFGGPPPGKASSEQLKVTAATFAKRVPEAERAAFTETAIKLETWVRERMQSATALETKTFETLYSDLLGTLIGLPAKDRARALQLGLAMADVIALKDATRVRQSVMLYSRVIALDPSHAAGFEAYLTLQKEVRVAGGEGLRLAVLSGRAGSKAFVERFAQLPRPLQTEAGKALEAIFITSNHVQSTIDLSAKTRAGHPHTAAEIAREQAAASARADFELNLVTLLGKQLDSGALSVPFTSVLDLRAAMSAIAASNAMTGDHAAAKKLFFGPPAKSAAEIEVLCRLISQQMYLGKPYDLSVVVRYFEQAKAQGLTKPGASAEKLKAFVEAETLTFESTPAVSKDAAKYITDPKTKQQLEIDSPAGAKVAKAVLEAQINATTGSQFSAELREQVKEFFGQHVGRAAFENMLCPTVPGYTVEVTGLTASSSAFSISAVIRDANGRAVGIINRSALKEHGAHGDKVVWINDSLHLDQDQHSAGMAKGIYAKTEAFLSIVAPGADTEIRLRANLTVGKYAWARMGYQFADAAQHDLVREDFMHLVDKHLAAYPDAVKDRVRKAIALCETPQDFASLTFVDDKGKEILITVPNSGEAKIENTPVGKAFFLDMPSGGWDAVKYPNASAKKDSKKLRR
jgi:hypothetical protein